MHVVTSTQWDIQELPKISSLTPSSCPSLTLTRLTEETSTMSLDRPTHVSHLQLCPSLSEDECMACAAVILSGSGGEQFRGFLVQARAVADGSPVGTFIDNGDGQTLSSCNPPEV